MCSVRKYKNTPEERMKLVDFYQSALGQNLFKEKNIGGTAYRAHQINFLE